MKKILFSHFVPPDCYENYIGKFEFTCPSEEKFVLSHEEAKEMLPEYDAFMCVGYKFPKELIDAGVKLQAVGNFGVGYDNIDWKYATEKNIFVVNAPNSVLETTAELTIALMLSIARGVVMYDKELRVTKKCKSYTFFDRDMLVFGKTLGIIGFGRIGKAVAKKAQGLGMKVVYYDVYRPGGQVEKELDVEYMPVDELLKTSDVVSLHMPYFPENHHFVNGDSFSLMKRNAYFINAARGPVVDELALAKALKDGVIRGAALDVFEFEPVVSDEIAELDNVVIVPHVGTNTLEVRKNIVKESLFGITELLSGKKPYNVVNPSVYDKVFEGTQAV